MDSQKDLAWKTRGILTDWLIQVHTRFRLLPETLYLAVNVIDRFLSARVVSLAKLQLVGITCMLLAAKVCTPPLPFSRRMRFRASNCSANDHDEDDAPSPEEREARLVGGGNARETERRGANELDSDEEGDGLPHAFKGTLGDTASRDSDADAPVSLCPGVSVRTSKITPIQLPSSHQRTAILDRIAASTPQDTWRI
jgi:hypothetical protein